MAVAPAAPLVAAPAWHGGALGVEVEVGGDSWTLDASKLDVDAFLGETVGGWAAMTCDVLQASWATGASRDDGVLTRTEAGTADVVLANPDRRYDPLWPSAPFYGRWQIGTRLRIFAGAPPAAPVLAWSGTIDTLTLDGYAAGAPVCHVAAIDAVGRMNARNPVPLATPVGAGESAHARLTRILTRAGVPAASLDVEPAGPPMGATTHVDAPGVEAQQVAQAARWTLWVDAAGVVHVHPFLIDATPVPPPDVIFDCTTPGHARALDVAYASDPLQVRSSIDATGTSGNVIHVQDDGSLDRYGVADSFTLPLQGDSDVSAWAAWLLARTSTPRPRLDRLEVAPALDPTGSTWAAVVGAALRQVIEVTLATRPEPTTYRVWVRGLGHRLDANGWQVSYVTSAFYQGADAGPWWTLDDSEFAKLGYYPLAPP
jgi:hypothetical protein